MVLVDFWEFILRYFNGYYVWIIGEIGDCVIESDVSL